MMWVAVFVANAAVLIVEIVGARALTPFFGSSAATWAGFISVVIVGLAVGYAGGGALADKHPGRERELVALILGSAGLLVVSLWSGGDALALLVSELVPQIGLTLGAVLAASVLMLVPCILLAAISPLAVKALMHTMDTSATVVGRLSAVGAIGSVAGSLGVGMFLIPYAGSRSLLVLTGVMLIALGYALAGNRSTRLVLGACVVAACIAGAANYTFAGTLVDYSRGTVVLDQGSSYGRIIVTDEPYGTHQIRSVRTSPYGVQCGAFLTDTRELAEGLPFAYTRAFDAVLAFTKDAQHVLLLGGCNYSYPLHLAAKLPGATLDVVEIDPAMTTVARNAFGFTEPPGMRVVHTDGRSFMRSVPERSYDIIVVDAFESPLTIPFELITKEAFVEIEHALSSDGVAVFNIIGSITGPGSAYVAAITETAKSVFPHATLYTLTSGNPDGIQNLLLVLRHTAPPSGPVLVPGQPEVLYPLTVPLPQAPTILTDDYAPVESLARSMVHAITRR